MTAKLAAVFTAALDGVCVTTLCTQLGISRQTFYKYRRRWQADGPAGLVERSRAPRWSPHAISVEVEDEIVRLRKTLVVDNGAQMIAYHLQRGGWPVPAVSTIHRVLVRRGLVTPQPHKRPRSAGRRFVWPHPNDCWQIDATLWALADGQDVWIMDVLDDHSRLLVAAQVCPGPTGAAAWDALCRGAARWGLPAHVLSDNGACFTSRCQPTNAGGKTDFERHLRALGIRQILSSPGHPQTCGKLERSHQTTKRWLAVQPAAANAQDLQADLNRWMHHYNHQRPHRALAGATPAQAWHATPRAQPGAPIADQPDADTRTVTKNGVINYRSVIIGIGRHLAGAPTLVVSRGDTLTVFGPGGLLRHLTLQPGQRTYPTGRRPGPTPRPRLLGPCQ